MHQLSASREDPTGNASVNTLSDALIKNDPHKHIYLCFSPLSLMGNVLVDAFPHLVEVAC